MTSHDASRGVHRAASVLHRLPAWVLAVAFGMSFGVAGVAWAFSSPPGSSPDDDYHLTSIYCPPPIERSGCTLVRDASGRVVGVEVPEEVAHAQCFAIDPNRSGACELTLSETRMVPTSRVDRGGYPGGYYIAMNRLVRPSVDGSVLSIRLANVALASVILGLLVWSAPRLSSGRVATVFLVTLTPLGIFFIASINPSSWALIGVPGFYVALHALLTETRRLFRWVHACLAIVCAAVASAARSDGAVYIAFSAVVALFIQARGGLATLALMRRMRWWLATPLAGMVVAAWSILTGRQASVAAATEGAQNAGRFGADVLMNNLINFPSLVGGFGGLSWGLGWLDTIVPSSASYPPSFFACLLLYLSLRRIPWYRLLGLLGILGAIFVISMYILFMQRQYVGEYVQPRYLLPLWTVAVAIAVLPRDGDEPCVNVSPLQSLVLWSGLGVAGSVALLTNIRRYVTGLEAPYFYSGIEWWWNMQGSLMGQGFLGQLSGTPRKWILVGSAAFFVACIAAGSLRHQEEYQPLVQKQDDTLSA